MAFRSRLHRYDPVEDRDWLTHLEVAALQAFPLERLLPALALRFTYTKPLRSAGATLQADIDVEGEGAMTLGASAYWGSLSLSCSRCHVAACKHGLAFVAELALSPALRGSVGSAALPTSLGAERAALGRRLAAERTMDRWFSAKPPAMLSGVTVQLSLESNHYRSTRYLAVRLRVPGQGGVLQPDEALPRLEPALRRALEVCAMAAGNRKALIADGPLMSLVIHLLRGQSVTFGGQPARWSDALVRPIITRGFAALPQETAPLRVRRGKHTPRPVAHVEPALPPEPALIPRFLTEDGSLDVPAEGTVFFPGPYPQLWVPQERTFFPVDPRVEPRVAAGFCAAPVLPLSPGAGPALHRALRERLRGSLVAIPAPEEMGLSPVETPVLELRLEGDPFSVRAELTAKYSFGAFVLHPSTPDGEPESPLEQRSLRDDRAEEDARLRLEATGLVYDATTRLFQADDDAALHFWAEALPRLRQDAGELRVLVPEHLGRLRLGGTLRSRVRLALEGGFLDANMAFVADGIEAEIEALRAALRKGRGWVALRDGTLARIHESVRDLLAEADEVLGKNGKARLSPHALGRVEHWAEQASEVVVSPAFEALRGRLRALSVSDTGVVPDDLHATLRPYQSQGLGWLQFLAELGVGGILADDMGLGKTLMTLALLLGQKRQNGAAPTLVVCPTSVVGNWRREAARFAPTLGVVVCHGAGRKELFDDLAAADVVVTSYALLRRDVEVLEAITFRTLVLDEAQNVKNADSETRRAVARLNATQRLALTGTPVENRLGELWSILDLCNPGMLGSMRSFEQRFERPIIASPTGRAALELRARIRPFVLRRTKRQVLTELPEKEEIDLVCEPSPEQQKVYAALAALLRAEVAKKLAEEGLARSGLVVLTAMLRLRQMSCDPRLVDPSRPAELGAKRTAFLELVRELVAEGRRALVFSQFVGLLSLWRKDLEEEGIAYEYLDGSTTDRDAVVDRFQKGDAPLFVISLKAGGAGLNLTAADTVIHCDPWWNPAVEDQATDRAHRMGQERKVTVYRLVLKGSIEDKIAVLKAKKRGLADAVIHDDAGALRGLAAEDVDLLLSDVDEDGPLPAALPLPAPVPTPVAQPPRTVVTRPAPAPRAAEPSAPATPPPGTETDAAEMTGDPLEALVERVKAYLEATGTTRTELGRRIGVAQSEMTRILRGYRRRMPVTLAARFEEAIR